MFFAHVQAAQVHGLEGWDETDCGFLCVRGALDAFHGPLQHAGVVTEARPGETAVGGAAEPVNQEDLRQVGFAVVLGDGVPVVEVVTGVVADEWQHGHRVTANVANGTFGGRGGFGGQCGAKEDTELPVARLGDQRDAGLTASSEQDSVNLDAIRVVIVLSQHVQLVDRGAEPGVRVGSRGVRVWGPLVAAPVGEFGRDLVGHAFPPDAAVFGQRHVGEDGVTLLNATHGIWVGGPTGARCDTEQAVFGVHTAQLAVFTEAHPVDVIAQGLGRPAFDGWIQQGQVGLTTGGGEGARNVVGLAFRGGEFQDEHVLGQPALVLGHDGGDAQCVSFFAKQCVAAVAGAVGPDGTVLGEVDNPFLIVARPWDVFLAFGEREAHGVDCRDKESVGFIDLIQHLGADLGHNAHRGHNIGGIGDFDTKLWVLGVEVAHDERDDVHGAATHGTVENPVHVLHHFRRGHPVVGEAGILLLFRADEGAGFHAGHVSGVGEGGEGVGELLFVKSNEGSRVHHLLSQTVVLFFRSVHPIDAVWFGELSHFLDPVKDALVLG